MDNESQNTKKKKKTMYIGIAAFLGGALCMITGTILMTRTSSIIFIPLIFVGLIMIAIGKVML